MVPREEATIASIESVESIESIERQWTGRPAASLVDELEALSRDGVTRVRVTDGPIEPDRARLLEPLCRAAALGLRIDFIRGVGVRGWSPPFAEALAAVAAPLRIAVLSTSPDVLRRLGRPHSVEEIAEALRLARDQGEARLRLVYLIDAPGESMAETNETLAGAWEHYLRLGAVPEVRRYVPQGADEGDEAARSPLACADPRRVRAYRNLEHKLALRDHDKIIINLSYRCNNHCRFCSVADRDRVDGSLGGQLTLLRQAADEGIRNVDLDGGEPLLYPHLFTVLRTAVGLGFDRITVTTNGRMLAYDEVVDKLAEVPGLALLVSLHSHVEATHEDLTRAPGSFTQTVAGIRKARERFGDGVGVNMTVTSANYRDIPGMVRLVAEIGLRMFNVQYYTPFGEVDGALAPPDDALAGVAREAIATARELGVRVNLVNFLYCLAPELADHMMADFFKAARRMRFVTGETVNLSDYLATQRRKDSRCGGCEWSILCGGFWRYDGGDGLTAEASTPAPEPVPLPVPTGDDERRVDLVDMICAYECNSGCVFCALDDHMRSIGMTRRECRGALARAMELYRPTKVRFGGGEPTLRPDLPALIAYARDSGAQTVSMQTNGYRLADERYLAALVARGLSKVNLSYRSIRADVYAQLTRIERSHALATSALFNVLSAGLELEIDTLISKPLLEEAADFIATMAGVGVRVVNFWYISHEGRATQRTEELIPDLTTTAAVLAPLFSANPGVQNRVCYIPYCFFPDNPAWVWNPVEENTLVVTPRDQFLLERGTIDIGVRTERCAGCARFDDCPGVRQNYLDLFGDAELRPLR